MKKQTSVETDEKGHDLQCSSGVGFACDCHKDPVIRQQSLAQLRYNYAKKMAKK